MHAANATPTSHRGSDHASALDQRRPPPLVSREVAGPDGKLWLIGNPIYINWGIANDCNGDRQSTQRKSSTAR